MRAPPLTGIKVLDLSSIIAAPVTATMLGDFGAEVVKVEQPGVGDFMRRSAPTPGGRSLGWVQDARNKTSITLDLHKAEARAIVHRLLPYFDVVVTNFRPPTLAKWSLDPDTLRAAFPRLIILYITGYGLTGPYSDRGAFDRIASAFSGLTYVSGDADRPPVRTGFALIDYMTAYMGAFSVVTALYDRDHRGGSGQFIDLALFEPGFRASEDALMRYAATGDVRERTGNVNLNVVPAANFLTRDGREICLHAGTDPLLRRLFALMGEPALIDDTRFATHHARVEHQGALYGVIGAWTSAADLATLMSLLVAAGIPASPVMNIADIAEDPHYRARGTVIAVQDPDWGDLLMAGPLPRMSETPGCVRSLGPALGNGNDAIYGELLGMDEAERAALREAGVI